MATLPKIPEGINSHMNLPSLAQVMHDPQFPAYLRMVAADLYEEPYSTVGSVLSNMCPQDIGSVLGIWLRQLGEVREGQDQDSEEDGEENPLIMPISAPSTFSYMLFTMLVARAEAGDVRFDPVTAGFHAELMATFMQSVVLANQYERVKVDLTKFTLNFEFLDQDFDQVISTDNFKALQRIRDVKRVWNAMKKSEVLALVRGEKGPKKEDLIPAPAHRSKFKKNSFSASLLDEVVPVSTMPKAAPSKSAKETLEAKLRRLSGG
jgi:hypothetical protein